MKSFQSPSLISNGFHYDEEDEIYHLNEGSWIDKSHEEINEPRQSVYDTKLQEPQSSPLKLKTSGTQHRHDKTLMISTMESDAGSGSSCTCFLYEPIHKSKELRLVTLFAGTGDEPIIVELKHYPIGSSPSYEAISYVWGDKRDVVQVLCNDKTMDIPRNLYYGLLKFRDSSTSRRIWVDSISINQKDKLEKGHQVNLMGLIFQEAQQVLAWLGNEHSAKPVDEALKFVKTTTERLNHELGPLRTLNNIQHAIFKANLPSQSIWRKHVATIDKIIQNQYFNRVWILQEIGLARTVTIYYGQHHVKLSTLMTFSKLFSFTATNSLTPKLDGRLNGLFDSIWSTFGTHYQTWMSETPLLKTLSRLAHKGRLNRGYICDFASILNATRNIETTKPVDRIYAILQHKWAKVTETGEPILQADYTISLTVLNKRLATRLCLVEGTLSHLRAVNHTSSMDILEDSVIPSWVKQWGTDSSVANLIRGFSDPVLQAKALDDLKLEIEDGRFLLCSGLILDEINGAVSNSFLLRNDTNLLSTQFRNFEVFEDCWDLNNHGQDERIKDLVSLFINHGSANFSLSVMAILLNLIKALKYSRHSEISQSIERIFSTEITAAVSSGGSGSLSSFSERIFKHLSSRRFFSTANGHVGYGPAILKQGDLCCVLFGCGAILIIRPTPGLQHYKLVGACVVAGLMDGKIGEFWSSGELAEVRINLS
jgi:hypothetical protein